MTAVYPNTEIEFTINPTPTPIVKGSHVTGTSLKSRYEVRFIDDDNTVTLRCLDTGLPFVARLNDLTHLDDVGQQPTTHKYIGTLTFSSLTSITVDNITLTPEDKQVLTDLQTRLDDTPCKREDAEKRVVAVYQDARSIDRWSTLLSHVATSMSTRRVEFRKADNPWIPSAMKARNDFKATLSEGTEYRIVSQP